MKPDNVDFQNRTWLHLLLILLIGILIYANSLYGPFTFDDKQNIVDNPVIKNISHFIDAKLFPNRFIGNLSFALNYKLHGLSIFGYHLFNIAIHLFNALCVYFLVKLLTQTRRSLSSTFDNNDDAGALALFVALLFVSHPVQTQAVTYIVQRFTSLATLFYLCSILAYLKSRLTVGKWAASLLMGGSLLCAVLAMKTKEFSFTLPFVLVLVEYIFFSGTFRQRARYLLLFLPTLAIIPWGLYAPTFFAGAPVSVSTFEATSAFDISRLDYFFTQLTVIVLYLRLLLFPAGQNLDYDYPVYRELFNPVVLGAATLLVALLCAGIFLWRLSRRDSPSATLFRISAFGVFWFFIALSVESSFIRITDLVYEHRLYLPSIGLFMTTVALVTLLKRYLEEIERPLARVIVPCGVGVVFLLAFATIARNHVWQDEISLWQDVVNKSPNKPRPHNNLALAYYEEGLYEEALRENQISLQLKVDPGVHLNIGNIRLKQDRLNEALQSFQTALALNQKYEKAYYGECNIYLKQKRFAEAQQSCETAIKLKPDYAMAYNLLGLTLLAQGDTEGALREYGLAIKYKPDVAVFHNNLANAFYQSGKLDAALDEYRIAADLNPIYHGINLNVGKIYRDLGRWDDVISASQAVLQFMPENQEALDLLTEARNAQVKRL